MSILIELEKKHNIKPNIIAKMLGISKSYYSMIRNGDRPISRNVAFKLRNSFGVKLEDSLCPTVHTRETEDRNSPKYQAS
ncbi:MAG: helix-turn-helix protein [Neobacillus sp.]|nr:helix-turn-helix protein [Neobacillus sp.]